MDRKADVQGLSVGPSEGLRMGQKGLYEEIIIAGFGGQGILLAGKVLAQTAMMAGMEVTYMPSYGAEVRGGTANCMVTLSDEPIACPVVDRCDTLIVMNKASLSKFGPRVKDGGLVILNSSLIDTDPALGSGIEVIPVPADGLAVELGSVRSANMVALGVYLAKRGHLRLEQAAEALPKMLAARHHGMLEVNISAMKRGAEFVRSYCGT